MKALLALGLLVACALLGGSRTGGCVNAVRWAAVDAVMSAAEALRVLGQWERSQR